MISTAANICLGHGKIFGGYVRDMFSGDKPNDIDLLVDNTDQYRSLLCSLIKKGTITEKKIGSEDYGVYLGTTHLAKLNFLEHGNDKQETIDIVYVNSGNISSINIDFEVNAMILSKKGIESVRSYFSIAELISQAQTKNTKHVMSINHPAYNKRLFKMKEKGYKIADLRG